MSNTLDLLLSIHPDKLKRPVMDIEIKRLSEAAGGKVLFSIQALTPDEEEEIRGIATSNDGDVDPVKTRIFAMLAGVKSPNLKDAKLLEKYGVITPKELVTKLLQPGEILQVYNKIMSLSGYGDDAVTELKNV
ncbi:phage tail assembly chaperone [Paenibacillus whitsoniae]|uniref:XkdN-like protein n=1 Tax=Paenibacillus whitsoniae TaxID=2496558 RepID=A0A3S0BRW1_9BACL|nr:XkdN-like protein [Paenibacillus whitsoniae]RTE05489.1 XkdN-like protein [Paenibacillus whitsoniae]